MIWLGLFLELIGNKMDLVLKFGGSFSNIYIPSGSGLLFNSFHSSGLSGQCKYLY